MDEERLDPSGRASPQTSAEHDAPPAAGSEARAERARRADSREEVAGKGASTPTSASESPVAPSLALPPKPGELLLLALARSASPASGAAPAAPAPSAEPAPAPLAAVGAPAPSAPQALGAQPAAPAPSPSPLEAVPPPKPAPRHESEPTPVQGTAVERRPLAAPAAERPAPTAPAPDPAALERAADVLRQIRLELRADAREARIQLRPLELGRIAIRIGLGEDGPRAELFAERRETLELLSRHVPELRAALGRDGLAPEQVELHLGFEGFDQRPHERDPREDARPAPRRASATLAPESLAHRPQLAAALARASGVDLYA